MAPELPRIFLLPTHLQPNEQHELEDSIPTLTYDVREADVVLGKISKRERALFELRRLKLQTEPLDGGGSGESKTTEQVDGASEPPLKHQRVSVSKPETKHGLPEGNHDNLASIKSSQPSETGDIIMVLKLAWLTDSLKQDATMPVDNYLLYRGRKIPSEPTMVLDPTLIQASRKRQRQYVGKPRLTGATLEFLERSTEDQQSANHGLSPIPISTSSSPYSPRKARRSGHGGVASGQGQNQPPALVHETTSEHDATLPLIPVFLNTTYSCQRPSPVNPLNAAFVEELKTIRTLRLLQGDQVGVRAYSTSIATLAAYPYPLKRPQEIARLPGCGTKIAELYQQWNKVGRTSETTAAEANPKLAVLKKFYDIWGVGDTTARQFYRKGWRDLDDIVEHGWDILSRVQQIGIKYYEEFQLKIPRAEVEAIANTILDHACRIEPGFQMVIVGGYRRGKSGSGDVDVVLSHPDEAKTLDMIDKLVVSLEKSHFITHTLSLWTRNSERGQIPLSWRGEGRPAGSGFDTLDKALVVWHDANGEMNAVTGTVPHRRVDIIISPWKTVGCAVVGWSGGTTFERDLRRYCKKEKGLKFDSSGIRSRVDGSWVDLEGGGQRGPAPDIETAERRVFEGLGLVWRPPEERCTG